MQPVNADRLHFFIGVKKQKAWQKFVCVPELKSLPLSILFHTHLLVQTSLNGGKLQRNFLHLVKQADNSANSSPNGERERQIFETYMESIIENGLEEPVTSNLLLNSALKQTSKIKA